jgi:hypothetical protein
MQLPFSVDAFLDVFAVYNTRLWPFALGLWAATVVVLIGHVRGADRHLSIWAVLAVQWAWAAIAYHVVLFSRINPAAWLFGVLFLVEAVLLLWFGVARRRLRCSHGHGIQERVGYILIAYGLLYPLVALADGHAYPRAPTFGVPCPTTIVTVGFLMLASQSVPSIVALVPLMWTVVAGSAAFALGMHADLALPVAGFVLGVDTWRRGPPVIREWYTRWGTEDEERRVRLPRDEIVARPQTD